MARIQWTSRGSSPRCTIYKFQSGINKSTEPTKRLICLWEGKITILNGAPQVLLLIVDFINDWAKEVYRKSIMEQPRRLVRLPYRSKPSQYRKAGPGSGFTSVKQETFEDATTLVREIRKSGCLPDIPISASTKPPTLAPRAANSVHFESDVGARVSDAPIGCRIPINLSF